MLGVLKRLLNYNERELRRLQPIVQRVNELEPSVAALPDAELAARTAEFRRRHAAGEPLDDLLPEVFAVVREASKRVLGLRHFDVQILGGIVLHEGKIAEMATGEGKTLVATLPAVLNGLTGKGVHVVTVNDYLAKRDSEWMGQLYKFLGLSVGLIVHGLDPAQRRAAYAADITYGTNNEFGFDYLRDNMVMYPQDRVQRGLHYAIVDEVDSILIDEARTPLIISGLSDKPTELYFRFARIVEGLEEGRDYTVDEKARTVAPTEEGIARVEKALGVDNLYANDNMDLAHYLENALKAKALMKRDRDYVVKDGEVIIVDEFTGRLMFGRRYSDGLHQAIEAKENVRIAQESQTLATITFQNYFRMYEKLAGMTGTAATEADEFDKIYKLSVVVIPTNKPMIRKDLPDVVYKTEAAKFRAIVREIKERHAKGQPILVGTASIEKSERLSAMLKREGIKHQVLNAKNHEQEAEIIAQAGRLGAVTISTNMAGRGTDILLGGNPEFKARQALKRAQVPDEVIAVAVEHAPSDDPAVLEARRLYREALAEAKRETDREHEEVVRLGGLHVIGSERHEARRIDNQLRGRAGRQGDPGSSRFYISLEDDLMRLFGSESLKGLMDRLGVEEDEPIEHPLVTRAIENAQRRVEARNFEIRKHLLEYDDVMNQQREVIYGQRRQLLEEQDMKPIVLGMTEAVVERWIETYCPAGAHPEEWDLKGLLEQAEQHFLRHGEISPEALSDLEREEIEERLLQAARARLDAKEAELGTETFQELCRVIALRTVDAKWIDHLDAMDDLREGIGLRAYGQRDPLIEYKMEAFEMFNELRERIQEDIVKLVFRLEVVRHVERQSVVRGLRTSHASVSGLAWAADGAGGAVAAAGAGAAGAAAGGAAGGAPPVIARGTARGGAAAAAPAERPQPVRVQKVGRNDPCPCGSGKKYKHCCGR
ncbi:MAG: preprotein translocase subunit SecA [Firmicutes bacterium]|nr:preprotein translocase subunit SecA [Bacillota bacterium]